MDIKTAEALSLLTMRINSSLDDSVAMVRDKGSPQDLQWYRQEVGKIMAGLYLDIQEKLWAEHPSLRPRQMKGDYVVDPKHFEPRFYPIRRDSDEWEESETIPIGGAFVPEVCAVFLGEGGVEIKTVYTTSMRPLWVASLWVSRIVESGIVWFAEEN
jgi:hypothetical protein